MAKSSKSSIKENVYKNSEKIKKENKFSREYKLGIYLAIGSIGGAYVWPILGFLLSIFGFVNSLRAVKTYKENKIPMILNIVAFIFVIFLLGFLKSNMVSI